MPDNLRGTSAEIWKAYNVRTWEQQRRREDGTTTAAPIDVKAGRDPQQFANALYEKEIYLARVTKDEADKSHREAEFAKAVGNYAASYREGEFVAVNKYGNVFKFTERNTGEKAQAVQQFLNKGEFARVLPLTESQTYARQLAVTRKSEIAAARLAWLGRTTGRAGLDNPVNTRRAISADKVMERGAGKMIDLGGAVANIVSGAFESLLAPLQPLSAAQIEDLQNRRENAARDAAQIGHDEAVRERGTDHARRNQHQEAEHRQREADEYKRLQRGGGERER